MVNFNNYLCHLIIIISKIILGYVLAESNGKTPFDLDSNTNEGKLIYVTLLADIRTINTDEIICYNSMINQVKANIYSIVKDIYKIFQYIDKSIS